MAKTDQLVAIVGPIVDSLDASLYDLEFEGGTLRITLDRSGGVDLDTISEVTRQVSRQLDLDDPIPGKYTLEVTSPGLERNLRTPAHWATAAGERVKVKLRPGLEGERRVEGVVLDAGEDTVLIDGPDGPVPVAFADVTRARTVFVWGPQPKPGSSGATKETSKS